jgi:hypothetical protein
MLEAIWGRVEAVCEEHDIPVTFPGITPGKGFRWGRAKPRGRAKLPGVLAHYRWAHADALVPECYCALRALGWLPSEAYARTLDLAQQGWYTPLPRPGGE